MKFNKILLLIVLIAVCYSYFQKPISKEKSKKMNNQSQAKAKYDNKIVASSQIPKEKKIASIKKQYNYLNEDSRLETDPSQNNIAKFSFIPFSSIIDSGILDYKLFLNEKEYIGSIKIENRIGLIEINGEKVKISLNGSPINYLYFHKMDKPEEDPNLMALQLYSTEYVSSYWAQVAQRERTQADAERDQLSNHYDCYNTNESCPVEYASQQEYDREELDISYQNEAQTLAAESGVHNNTYNFSNPIEDSWQSHLDVADEIWNPSNN